MALRGGFAFALGRDGSAGFGAVGAGGVDATLGAHGEIRVTERVARNGE